jgi:hypothetical protein
MFGHRIKHVEISDSRLKAVKIRRHDQAGECI